MSSKLVRDKIPSIILKSGKAVLFYYADDEEYIKRLKDKIVEEANEVKDAKSSGDMIMELADLYEVMVTLARQYNVPLSFIQQLASDKREAKGGFEKRIILEQLKK